TTHEFDRIDGSPGGGDETEGRRTHVESGHGQTDGAGGGEGGQTRAAARGREDALRPARLPRGAPRRPGQGRGNLGPGGVSALLLEGGRARRAARRDLAVPAIRWGRDRRRGRGGGCVGRLGRGGYRSRDLAPPHRLPRRLRDERTRA